LSFYDDFGEMSNYISIYILATSWILCFKASTPKR